MTNDLNLKCIDDMFKCLNILNTNQRSNIYYTSNKIGAFMKKLSLFILHICKKDLSSFEILTKF